MTTVERLTANIKCISDKLDKYYNEIDIITGPNPQTGIHPVESDLLWEKHGELVHLREAARFELDIAFKQRAKHIIKIISSGPLPNQGSLLVSKVTKINYINSYVSGNTLSTWRGLCLRLTYRPLSTEYSQIIADNVLLLEHLNTFKNRFKSHVKVLINKLLKKLVLNENIPEIRCAKNKIASDLAERIFWVFKQHTTVCLENQSCFIRKLKSRLQRNHPWTMIEFRREYNFILDKQGMLEKQRPIFAIENKNYDEYFDNISPVVEWRGI